MIAKKLVKEWLSMRRTSQDYVIFAQREGCTPEEIRECLKLCGVADLPKLPQRKHMTGVLRS